MKTLFQNQGIEGKISKQVERCLTQFHELTREYSEEAKRSLCESNPTIYTHMNEATDMILLKVERFDQNRSTIDLVDGVLAYRVEVRDLKSVVSTGILWGGMKSVVLLKRWGIEIMVSERHEIFFKMVVFEMQCVDTLTISFSGLKSIDLTQPQAIVNTESKLQMCILKGQQLLKNHLFKSNFILHFYNLTRSKTQPKLLNICEDLFDQSKKLVEDPLEDFGEGCSLKKVKREDPFISETSSEQIMLDLKKRITPSTNEIFLPMKMLKKANPETS